MTAPAARPRPAVHARPRALPTAREHWDADDERIHRDAMAQAKAHALREELRPGELAALLSDNEAVIAQVMERREARLAAEARAENEAIMGTGPSRPVTAPESPPTASSIPYMTPRDIADSTSQQPDWLVTGLLARQAITEVDGKVKAAGKTTLIMFLVAAVLDGEPFLGMPTTSTKVVYITEQQPGPFRTALARAGLLERGDELRVVFRRAVGSIPWPELVATIAADARRDGYGLLVIDTLGKLSGIRDENDAALAAQAMAPVQDAAHDGLAALVARHDRKGSGEVGESGRGSSAFSGDADIILQLRRPEGRQPTTRRVIETLSRYSETPEKVIVELTPDGYLLLGDAEAVALADALRITSALIAGGLGGTNGPTIDELVAESAEGEVALSRTTVQRAIRELDHRRELTVSGRGVKGDPKRYQLRPTDQNDDSALTHGLIGQNEFDGPADEPDDEQLAYQKLTDAPAWGEA